MLLPEPVSSCVCMFILLHKGKHAKWRKNPFHNKTNTNTKFNCARFCMFSVFRHNWHVEDFFFFWVSCVCFVQIEEIIISYVSPWKCSRNLSMFFRFILVGLWFSSVCEKIKIGKYEKASTTGKRNKIITEYYFWIVIIRWLNLFIFSSRIFRVYIFRISVYKWVYDSRIF